MKAIWNHQIIAQSDETILIENNHYFPAEDVKKEFLKKSEIHTVCPWKGQASYYHVIVDGKTNMNAAWYYPQPKPMAEDIHNYVAFWQGVQIVKE